MYSFTQHFKDQMRKRRIGEQLIGWCLAKGAIDPGSNHAMRFKLNRSKLEEAIRQGAATDSDLIGAFELVVVVESKRLITVFVRRGDTGISTSNLYLP